MHKSWVDPGSIVRVQTWDATAAAPSAIEQALGVAWPRETSAVAVGRADIICVGPTDWLVVASSADMERATLLQSLDVAFEGSAFRATNLSQALACIEICGTETRELLAKGCALDLHPSVFPPGRSARTRFASMPVIVRCIAPSTFHCIVSLSYRDYLHSWLLDAAVEFERLDGP
jgi:sarcosine oxidase subunit gamma